MTDINDEYNEATRLIRDKIKTHPNCSDSHLKLGLLYKLQGAYQEALTSFQNAIALDPNRFEAYNSMGTVLRTVGNHAKAAACFRKALELNPRRIEALLNLGNTLQCLSDYQAAIACYQKALELDGNFILAYYNLGIAYQTCGNVEPAVSCFRRVVAAAPLNSSAHSYLLHQYQHLCLWDLASETGAKLDFLSRRELDSGQVPGEPPFLNIARHCDPSINSAIAKAWSQRIARNVSSRSLQSTPHAGHRDKKIVIGYFSKNFRNHASSHLLNGIFELHDHKDFRILCYSWGKSDNSSYRKSIEGSCDQFIDITSLSHSQAAQRIRQDGVQILIDLMGHTAGHRLEVCAMRPAPVQVRWLGLAGPTGADFFDYLITDAIVTPIEHARYYTEKFILMPHSYQVNDGRQGMSSIELTRRDLGLPEKGVVFCSFCSNYKIDRPVFLSWIKILSIVDESVLWLLPQTGSALGTLRKEAEKHGISPKRIVGAAKLPKDRHLTRLRLADIALDTWTVNGAATTSDALWANVPVVALLGTHFASRMSSSILSAAGLTELIACAADGYEKIAVDLALNPSKLMRIKDKLKNNIECQPLFDTTRYVRNLESAFRAMWAVHGRGESPRHMVISDVGPTQQRS